LSKSAIGAGHKHKCRCFLIRLVKKRFS